ncbi:ubiquitin carboxyl-terminal hydrolase-domain-containing protein [Neurospora tetraspora]|uniref:ubiquitinyl hydrolase 1 n=1 Tax=Neurospora tetraspora TaxID=94610 RepID=A0AAE0JK34_9PEZI|nr:ubiquitin carboxyl-terminal hydrolase-domain-containing protein [Neurospora tetraspora]
MEKLKGTKTTSLVPKKFRSVREKNGTHSRNKSTEPGPKSRPLGDMTWLSFLRPESAKQALREKEEVEKEAAKIAEITKQLEELNYTEISEQGVRFSLNSKFANGDLNKAIELIRLQQKAVAGIIQPYNPNISMQGAENRGNVTCYLDALLFAMFAKLSAFECMLKNDPADENQRRLAALLRLWVNMLRSGMLIHTDMTQLIQESLAACGWEEAQDLEQQDTSEAFAFITETLQLPLLALQVDLFHQGKKDEDDHKVVHERLLNLAVPPDPDGKGIKLEDCLEEYFNNKVDVFRDSVEEKKGDDEKGPLPRETVRLISEDEDGQASDQGDNSPHLQRRWTTQDSTTRTPVSMLDVTSARPELPAAPRHRSTSIIQRIVVEDRKPPLDAENETLLQKAKRTSSTVVKAVTIPAWQFFRLIPWHATASNGEPSNDVEVARHFNQRPVVGICLKRYTMTETGFPIRQNTLIDIPDSMRLPHFMMPDDDEKQSNGLSQEYKLVLQSVVCHRGDSLHSGHYVSFARVAPKLLTDNRRYEHDPPPDYEEAQWVKFDDLDLDNRVSYVDDIRDSLRQEMPYLLFYQIVPMVDVTTASSDGSVGEPPSYNESTTVITGVPGTPSMEPLPERPGGMSRSISDYFDSASTLVHNGGGPNIRFSTELERPARLSLDDDPYGTGSAGHLRAGRSRRGSLAVSDTTATTAITPSDVGAPSMLPTTPQEESTATRLGRAAAKFKSKSRPVSQAGETRISLTMSRWGLARPSRDTLNKDAANGAGNSSEGGSDEQQPDAKEVEDASDKDQKEKNKDKEKEKEGHHHLHHYRKSKKDKGRDKEDTKEKGKDKEGKKEKGDKSGKNKETGKDGVPDRECAVM